MKDVSSQLHWLISTPYGWSLLIVTATLAGFWIHSYRNKGLRNKIEATAKDQSLTRPIIDQEKGETNFIYLRLTGYLLSPDENEDYIQEFVGILESVSNHILESCKVFIHYAAEHEDLNAQIPIGKHSYANFSLHPRERESFTIINIANYLSENPTPFIETEKGIYNFYSNPPIHFKIRITAIDCTGEDIHLILYKDKDGQYALKKDIGLPSKDIQT